MLVSARNTASAAVWWRRGMWVSALVFALAVLSLAPYLKSSAELVRMRNALVLTNESDGGFDWTPASVPPSYLQERGPIDPLYADVVDRLALAVLPDDWARVLAISRHLLGSAPAHRGGPIMSDMRGTYRRIVIDGQGYCGDFVDVFVGIALAAGIPVRSWAFSFDGFGGHGHIWPEIWNRQLGRWQLLDIFNNYYFFETAGVPLSALEFRRAMLGKSQQLKLAPLYAGAAVGWRYEEKAWDYYRRGLPEWYMWWGNNVFTHDRALLVRSFSGMSRSLEELGAIAQGVFPGVRLMVNETNRDKAHALWRLRWHLFIVAWVGFLAVLSALFCFVAWARVRRRQPSVSSTLCAGHDVF